ncbi:hypothetical protein E4T44_08291 [Aureobasidium sp. EXF-8845]|nr:hypothetical protein E4T44_08291 [Aureobasidium sp. EXF-8845]KAI4843197.1 hypothetical protein E4T45_08724 [Aureobasidium sp. EXF-8846]
MVCAPAPFVKGCGLSRESPAAATDANQNAVRHATTEPSSTTARGAPSRSSSANSPTELVDRPNQPLRAAPTVKHSPPQLALTPWTPSELARQREAFFETRVSGRPEMWAAMKQVTELVGSGDLKAAQTILDATGATCPTGKICVERRRGGQRKGGIYDDKGLLYEIPGWVVSDPEDLVAEPIEGKEINEESEDEIDAEKGVVMEEKIGEMVSVRARLSDRGTDVVVEMGTNQKVLVLVKKVQEKAGIEQKIKFAYMGKIIDEQKVLSQTGWKDGHILNALVFG